MKLFIILICHFIIGFSIVDWIISVLPKYWEDKFQENALEADELQDAWYENENVILCDVIPEWYEGNLTVLIYKDSKEVISNELNF